jgi:hypothetical protein
VSNSYLATNRQRSEQEKDLHTKKSLLGIAGFIKTLLH